MKAIRRYLSDAETAYGVILVLMFVMYKLGFELKLPLLKRLTVYLVLAVGVIPVTTLYMWGLPIVEALLVAVPLMALVRLRQRVARRREKREGAGREVGR